MFPELNYRWELLRFLAIVERYAQWVVDLITISTYWSFGSFPLGTKLFYWYARPVNGKASEVKGRWLGYIFLFYTNQQLKEEAPLSDQGWLWCSHPCVPLCAHSPTNDNSKQKHVPTTSVQVVLVSAVTWPYIAANEVLFWKNRVKVL